jgi:hypothetical protein
VRQEKETEAEPEERSYAKWFVAGVGLLLLLLAVQVIISIRRDREVAHADDEDDLEPVPAQPAYLDDLEFREQNLPPDPPVKQPPATKAPAKRPSKKATAKKATPPTPPAPPTVTKRTRGQKKPR